MRGKTVVCTIHQPSSEAFALFDRLVLLAEGRIAYQGSSTGALTFFERLHTYFLYTFLEYKNYKRYHSYCSMGYSCPATYNPADFYVQTLAMIPGLEVSSRATVRTICDRFAVTSTSKQIDLLIQYEASLGQDMLDIAERKGHQPIL